MDNRQLLRFMDVLEDLEKQRKWVAFLFLFSNVPLVLSFIIAIFSREYYIYFFASRLFLLPFFLSFAFFMFAMNKKKLYAKRYKRYIVEYGINNYFENVTYRPDDGIDEHTVFSTGMIYKGNHFESEDLITGIYKGVPFTQSDVRIQHRQGKSNYSKRVEYFTGRWMIFRFNKNFVCNLQVVEKGLGAYKNGRDSFGGKLEKIELDDEAFNKAFRTNCENQQEAYYILTPQMMRRMLDLKENTKGQLMFCFLDNALHIACNTGKNSFEPPIFRKIDLQRIMDETYSDLSLITSFIDFLNLDNKLFKN
ncbi:MAG: DUF3137 domain-containing protein [Clostridiales bacterium]|nr:DUF3137 domain-containing protein [Clostridiales bacterium]